MRMHMGSGGGDPFQSFGFGGNSAFGGSLFGGMQQQQRQHRDRIGILKSGTAVYIYSLTGAMQHNGRIGKVKFYDDSKGRYTVDVGLESGLFVLRFLNI